MRKFEQWFNSNRYIHVSTCFDFLCIHIRQFDDYFGRRWYEILTFGISRKNFIF